MSDESDDSGDNDFEELEEDRGPIVFDAAGHPVTPTTVVEAYLQRCFPMADTRDGQLSWYRPSERAIINWDTWKIPRSLQKTWKQQPYTITHDTDFPAIIQACAKRETTWIGFDIETLYVALHERGLAHSVEVWDAEGALVGGLYGLSLGAVFCGESMFHTASNASKLAAIYLVQHLQKQGFELLDCQQQTPHMQRFGAFEVDDEEYQGLFEAAVIKDVGF